MRNLICITGDPPKLGNYPDATAVFDVDSIGLVNIVHNLNRGLDIGGNPIGHWHKLRHRRRRESRACPISTKRSAASNTRWKPGRSTPSRSRYSTSPAGEFSPPHRALPDPGGRRHLAAHQRAQCRVHEERVARSMPDEILAAWRRRRRPKPRERKASPSPARCWRRVRDMVQGAQISAPFGRYSCAVDVLEALGGSSKTAVV